MMTAAEAIESWKDDDCRGGIAQASQAVATAAAGGIELFYDSDGGLCEAGISVSAHPPGEIEERIASSRSIATEHGGRRARISLTGRFTADTAAPRRLTLNADPMGEILLEAIKAERRGAAKTLRNAIQSIGMHADAVDYQAARALTGINPAATAATVIGRGPVKTNWRRSA